MDIRKLTEEIQGTPATQQQIDKLRAIAQLTKTSEDDPLFAIIATLEGYAGLFEKTPKKIISECENAAKNAAETAVKKTEYEISYAVSNLSEAAKDGIQQSIKYEVTKRACIGISIVSIVIVIFFAFGWYFGAKCPDIDKWQIICLVGITSLFSASIGFLAFILTSIESLFTKILAFVLSSCLLTSLVVWAYINILK